MKEKKKEIRMQRNESNFFFNSFFFILLILLSIWFVGFFFMHVRLDKYTNINLKLYFFLKCLCMSKLDAICYRMTCHLHIRGKKNISVFGRYLILRLITVNYFFLINGLYWLFHMFINRKRCISLLLKEA